MTVQGHPPAPAGPGGGARCAALDVARGLAVLGTFATNVRVFTDPLGRTGFSGGGAAGTPPAWRPAGATVLAEASRTGS